MMVMFFQAVTPVKKDEEEAVCLKAMRQEVGDLTKKGGTVTGSQIEILMKKLDTLSMKQSKMVVPYVPLLSGIGEEKSFDVIAQIEDMKKALVKLRDGIKSSASSEQKVSLSSSLKT